MAANTSMRRIQIVSVEVMVSLGRGRGPRKMALTVAATPDASRAADIGQTRSEAPCRGGHLNLRAADQRVVSEPGLRFGAIRPQV